MGRGEGQSLKLGHLLSGCKTASGVSEPRKADCLGLLWKEPICEIFLNLVVRQLALLANWIWYSVGNT